jgi:predicted ABC-type ATPase
MINNRLAKLSAKADRLLDSRQKARFKDLSAIEKVLVARLIQELSQQLEEKDKRITSRKGFVSLAKAIDSIFDEVEKKHLRPMSKDVVKDLQDVVDFGAQFYQAQKVKGGQFDAIHKEVDREMRRRMGINDKGSIQQASYLDELFRTDPARDEVKKMVAKSVSAGIPMRALEKKLRVMVAGTDAAAGVLERRIGGFVLDAYQAADSITNNAFGKRLGMKSFVYSGGLIETSREFCRKRNNKTFTTEEAKEWEKDPTLPRTKAEKDSGVITDYDPLVDRGRWNCRHRILYISDSLAQATTKDAPQPSSQPVPEAKAFSKDMKVGGDPTGVPPQPAPGGVGRPGAAHMPGSAAHELREAHRAARNSSQDPITGPGLNRKGQAESLLQHTTPEGKLTEQREKLHQEIIADALSGVPASEKPTMFMMGGGPASGKSTLIKQGVVTHPDLHVLLNPDEFKEDLPEYREMVKAGDTTAAAFAHDESSDINKKVMRLTAANKQETVWDGTGDGDYQKLKDRVQMFKNNGFRVVADYVTVPTNVAVKRVYDRGIKTGRFVPEADVRNTHKEVSRVLPRAIADGLFDEMTLWDTSTPILIKVAVAKGRQLTILNTELWQRFLAKGEEVVLQGIKPQ